jgi:ERO1-like protein alpha
MIFSFSFIIIYHIIKVESPQEGEIADLNIKATIEKVEEISPFLTKLTNLKYFRFFRVDLSRSCEFWVSNAMCTQKLSCSLCECPKEKLPKSWLDEDLRLKEAKSFNKFQILEHIFESNIPTPHIEKEENIQSTDPNIWKLDQINDNSIYVDLHEDKEEFTGYQGRGIWEVIYKENCKKFYDMCTNNKLLYRLISGLHTSVSTHLSFYFKDHSRRQRPNIKYIPNMWLYLSKVGQHSERLTNLIYATSLLMKGISRYANEISQFPIELDDLNEELKTKDLLKKLLNSLSVLKEKEFLHSDIFSKPLLRDEEKERFTKYFWNIAQIMDCVECQKCKVYGKMQVLGLATALRKLLNEEPIQLTRNELVALINTLKKWVESIEIWKIFKKELMSKKKDILMCMFGVLLMVLLLIRIFRNSYNDYQKTKSEKEKIEKKEEKPEKKEKQDETEKNKNSKKNK